jgi:hypothetical protein
MPGYLAIRKIAPATRARASHTGLPRHSGASILRRQEFELNRFVSFVDPFQSAQLQFNCVVMARRNDTHPGPRVG